MAALPDIITVEQFRQLPEGGEYVYELHYGEVVALTRPKPRHWMLQKRLFELLDHEGKNPHGLHLHFRLSNPDAGDVGNLPPVRGLPPKFFQEAIADDDNILIDTRMMLAFGGGHIKGAFSIGSSPMLSIWAGWLLDPAKPILLVLESAEKLNEIVRLFLRTGYTKFAGYLVGAGWLALVWALVGSGRSTPARRRS